MDTKSHNIIIVKGTLDIVNDLNKAIRRASGKGLTVTEIKEMTLIEFLANIAVPNAITFTNRSLIDDDGKKI